MVEDQTAEIIGLRGEIETYQRALGAAARRAREAEAEAARLRAALAELSEVTVSAANEKDAEIARLRALLARWLVECDPSTGNLVDLFEDTEDALLSAKQD